MVKPTTSAENQPSTPKAIFNLHLFDDVSIITEIYIPNCVVSKGKKLYPNTQWSQCMVYLIYHTLSVLDKYTPFFLCLIIEAIWSYPFAHLQWRPGPTFMSIHIPMEIWESMSHRESWWYMRFFKSLKDVVLNICSKTHWHKHHGCCVFFANQKLSVK